MHCRCSRRVAYYFTLLSVGPLLGSFITEPAAMTLAALLLRDRYLQPQCARATSSTRRVGVLFVNVSIGGTLTPYAAPPVLMVADKWGLDIVDMLTTFGWKAAMAVVVNAAGVAFAYSARTCASSHDATGAREAGSAASGSIGVHLAFLAGVVVFSHHPSSSSRCSCFPRLHRGLQALPDAG